MNEELCPAGDVPSKIHRGARTVRIHYDRGCGVPWVQECGPTDNRELKATSLKFQIRNPTCRGSVGADTTARGRKKRRKRKRNKKYDNNNYDNNNGDCDGE